MSYYEDNPLEFETEDDEFDGCVHGIPWDEPCELCGDDDEEFL